MAKKVIVNTNQSSTGTPYLTPDARENELISLAYDAAEEQIRNGTASSQIITYFLKLRNERDKKDLEIEKLQNENKLLKAKADAYESQKEKNHLYAEAIKAMGIYSGELEDDDVSEMEKQEVYDDLLP